ncbi:TadE/TadG family type IV pilus assembly protein [Sphingomonas rubra]|nr:Tad domain-containing protein [Sphingomonas rubra]
MRNVRFKLTGAAGFLTRLRRDRRGSTLTVIAAAIVPLAGMVGSGLDLSRLYLVKTRLQHACDAGVLAGRKSMGAGIWTQSNGEPLKTANRFFDGNFEDGAYGSQNRSRTFTEAAGKVSGRAQADVPMTLMRIFSKPTMTMAVTCDAEMRLPNTDVMFVLDTTGSMADAQPGDSVSKMSALKTAVKCFYEIVARLDTNAVCTTGPPTGGTGSQVQIRFEFVPYATNVNVGYLLKPEWFANEALYQTRVAEYADRISSTDPAVTNTIVVNKNPRNDWTTTAIGIVSSTRCNQEPVPPNSSFMAAIGSNEGSAVENNTTGGNPSTTTWATYQYGFYYEYQRTYEGITCRIQRQTVYGDLRRTYTRTDTTSRVFNQWRYAQLPVNISLLKNGSSWNRSFTWPVGSQAADKTITWGGCIEERQTASYDSYTPRPNDVKDLDIDSLPVAGDASTQWRQVLPDVIYTRQTSSGRTRQEIKTADELDRDFYYACPREARKLQKWPSASTFSAYVDGLSPEGNTYHDIGLLWGARLASPTGIFGPENALTPQGGEIERNIIFMTDGDACTGVNNYTAYGVGWWDRRTTGSRPTDGCTDTGTLTQQVNARAAALCTAIKNKNITLWVVAFGQLEDATVTRLKACASSGRYFTATNSAQLQATFKSIADQISMLRLTS